MKREIASGTTRTLEEEAVDNLEEAQELDRMSLKYIYILNEAMARSVLNLGLCKGRILEIGIGPARIATRIAKYNPQLTITGIDLSSTMLNIAKKNIEETGIGKDKILLVKADAKQLPFEAESFDAVISQNMLHHLPDPATMFREIKRVIKPEGAILIRDVVRPPNEFLAKLYATLFGFNYTKRMRKMYYDSMLAAFSVGEIRKIVKDCGFSDTNIKRHFLTHYGIEREFKNKGKVGYTPDRMDLLREIMLRLYIKK